MKFDLTPAKQRFPDHKFSQRVRNNRVYITIKPGKDIHPDYTSLSCILRDRFPEIRVTSGSAYGVTGVMPTLLELIHKSQDKSWAAMLRTAMQADRAWAVHSQSANNITQTSEKEQ